MTTQKSFVTRLGELIDSQRAEQREAPQPGSARLHPVLRLLRWFIPNGGTLLIAAVLIFTQRVWAQGSLAPTSAPGPSATTVNYQGRLANSGGAPLTGNYGMTFTIWDAASGGNSIWGPESHDAVPVSSGLFSVGLGSRTSGGIPPTMWNGDRYLEITVGGETLSPRELIRSVPIAGMALTVPDGSITEVKIADGAITSAKLEPGTPNLVQSGSANGDSSMTGWNLHLGTGVRVFRKTITFPIPYSQVPQVLVSLQRFEDGNSAGSRVGVLAQDITVNGFEMEFVTYADSVVYGMVNGWVAIGVR